MSAPNTNVDKQEKEHKPSLLGIRGAVVFGALMLILVIFFTVMRGEAPTEETVIGTQEEQTESDAVAVDEVEPGTNESD